MRYTEISDGLPFSLLLRFFSCYLWLYFHCDFSSLYISQQISKEVEAVFFFFPPLLDPTLSFPLPSSKVTRVLPHWKQNTPFFFFGVYVRLLSQQI